MVESASDDHSNSQSHWVSRAAFPLVNAALIVTQIVLGFAYHHGLIWLCVPLVLLVSHFMHGVLVGFHELRTCDHSSIEKQEVEFVTPLDKLIRGGADA